MSHVVVEPAFLPQLSHSSVHQRVAGVPSLPRTQMRAVVTPALLLDGKNRIVTQFNASTY